MAEDLAAEKDAFDLRVAQNDLSKLENIKKMAADAKLDVVAAKISTEAAGLLSSDMAKANANNMASTLGLFATTIDGAIGEQTRKVEMLNAKIGTAAGA